MRPRGWFVFGAGAVACKILPRRGGTNGASGSVAVYMTADEVCWLRRKDQSVPEGARAAAAFWEACVADDTLVDMPGMSLLEMEDGGQSVRATSGWNDFDPFVQGQILDAWRVLRAEANPSIPGPNRWFPEELDGLEIGEVAGEQPNLFAQIIDTACTEATGEALCKALEGRDEPWAQQVAETLRSVWADREAGRDETAGRM